MQINEGLLRTENRRLVRFLILNHTKKKYAVSRPVSKIRIRIQMLLKELDQNLLHLVLEEFVGKGTFRAWDLPKTEPNRADRRHTARHRSRERESYISTQRRKIHYHNLGLG